MIVTTFSFFFSLYGDHQDLHVLTHSLPTRRSSDLLVEQRAQRNRAHVKRRKKQEIKKGIARGRLSRWPGKGDGKFNICKRRKRCLDFPCLPTCAMKSLRNTSLDFTGTKSGFNATGHPHFSHLTTISS